MLITVHSSRIARHLLYNQYIYASVRTPSRAYVCLKLNYEELLDWTVAATAVNRIAYRSTDGRRRGRQGIFDLWPIKAPLGIRLTPSTEQSSVCSSNFCSYPCRPLPCSCVQFPQSLAHSNFSWGARVAGAAPFCGTLRRKDVFILKTLESLVYLPFIHGFDYESTLALLAVTSVASSNIPHRQSGHEN